MKISFNDYEPKHVMRFIREYHELTQKEFGKLINKSERTIQDYEAGRRNYNTKTLKLIAQVCNSKISIEK